MIPLNKVDVVGEELQYVQDTIAKGHLAKPGYYADKCKHLLEEKYGYRNVLLTNGGTQALEMCALLLDIEPGDEIIMPSFISVSTANAFALRGFKIVFADIDEKTLNITARDIEKHITENTKAVVVNHYAGVACKMDEIKILADQHHLYIIENASLGFDAYYKHQALGSIGHLGILSFRDDKNISAGQAGALIVNDKRFDVHARYILDRGTNRAEFTEGLQHKFNWVSLGSSYSISELSAAFLFGQLEALEKIQKRRISIWNRYKNELTSLELDGHINLPFIPGNSANNGVLFYLHCEDEEERSKLMQYLQKENIRSAPHYNALHSSPYHSKSHKSGILAVTDTLSRTLLRLPLYYSLSANDQSKVIETIQRYYSEHKH